MTGEGAGARSSGLPRWRRREVGALPLIVANAARPWINPWPTDEAAVARVRTAWAPVLAAAAHRDDTSPVDLCEEDRRA